MPKEPPDLARIKSSFDPNPYMSHRIGLLSDTHDNVALLDVALKCFAQNQCSALVHLGDICTPETFRYLRTRPPNTDLFWILGNEDVDSEWLSISER